MWLTGALNADSANSELAEPSPEQRAAHRRCRRVTAVRRRTWHGQTLARPVLGPLLAQLCRKLRRVQQHRAALRWRVSFEQLVG